MASHILWGCVIGLLVCTICETSKALRSNNASLSLTIDSKLALFLVQNTTQGIIISITPLCSDAPCSTPEAITIDNVFLPARCSFAPCDYMLFKKEVLNESVVQYLIGVPANQSMVLLRFLYETTLQLFEMVEKVVANQGITDCSPTSVVQLNEQYYTLCVNEVNTNTDIQFLRIDSLEDLSHVSFNPITNIEMFFSYPITGFSVLDYIHFIVVRLLLANGPIVTILDIDKIPGIKISSSIYITKCVGMIHQLKLRNNTDIYSTIPYLIYCETNYIVLDTLSSDDPIVISSHYYNETGYPVICSNENGSIVAEIAIIQSDFNSTTHYRGMTIIIPGQEIDLEKSVCFGIEKKLFYLYSDSILGAVFVKLETGNWTFLSSLSAIRTNLQVFDNRYVLLEEVFSASNVTLRLFDVLVQDFVVVNLDHASNFVQLLQLPQQKPAEEGLTTEYKILIGIGVFILIIAVIIIAPIIHRMRTRERPSTPLTETSTLLAETIDKKDVQCAICSDVWYQPVLLKCGHTFCRRCILQNMPYCLTCSICRKVINELPMFYTDSTTRLLNGYFQQNQGVEERLRGHETISQDEFCRRFEDLYSRHNERWIDDNDLGIN